MFINYAFLCLNHQVISKRNSSCSKALGNKNNIYFFSRFDCGCKSHFNDILKSKTLFPISVEFCFSNGNRNILKRPKNLNYLSYICRLQLTGVTKRTTTYWILKLRDIPSRVNLGRSLWRELFWYPPVELNIQDNCELHRFTCSIHHSKVKNLYVTRI